MSVKNIQYLLASVFVVLGGWCLVAPSSVMLLSFQPQYHSQDPIVTFAIGCFGAQALISGLFAALSTFNKRTFLGYGIAWLPFFVFDYYFYAVVPMLTFVGLLDAVGNVVMLALCYLGWKAAEMTASNDIPARKGRRLISVNAIFLGLMAIFGISQDILSYMFGTGRFGNFLFGDARAVGMIEAHGLAGIIAVAAFVHMGTKPIFWHGLLGIVHAFLGSCNLIFFDGYIETGQTRFAIAVTAIHFSLAALHALSMQQLFLRDQPAPPSLR